VSLFLTGFGAKLWLIGRFGSSLPFWDQWAEAPWAYMPYFEHHLTFLKLFSGHNETRPFFSRVYALGLLLLSGQWDARVQMVLNAAIHALTITGFGWVIARSIGRQCWPWLWLALAAVIVLPFAWENTLAGLHSQFYFMVMFSLATLWLLVRHPAWSWPWWLGVLTGICAIFNVASGFLAASAVFVMLLIKIAKRRENWQQHVPTLAVCALISIAGVLLKADAPYHARLQAHSVSDFAVALGNNLAWPWIVVPYFAPLNCLPLFIVFILYLRSRERELPAEELALTTGFWILVSAAATAFARGTNGATPQWRYMDATSFAFTANAIATLILLHRWRGSPALLRFGRAAALAWVMVNAAGLILLTRRAWQVDIPERDFYLHAQLKRVRAFMATDNMACLDAKVLEERPFPHPNRVAWILRDPDIRSRLPACARDPLAVTPSPGTTNVFVPRGWNLRKPDPPTEVSWGSFNAKGAAATGTFESQPVRASRFPYLQIEVAGDLGQPGLSLELVDTATKERTPVKPRHPPGTGWEACEVKAPKGDFTIFAADKSPTAWFAFKEPREMARVPFWNLEFIRLGPALFAIGMSFYLVGVACSLRSRPTEREPDSH
jgi:hypothetical protein